MAERSFPWKWVALAIGVATAALLVVYQRALSAMVHTYYLEAYEPETIDPAELGAPPPAARLADVPALADPLPKATSVSLRMLLGQRGPVPTQRTVDFFTGATWGATPIPQRTGFFPGRDPEVGLLHAAHELGWPRRYLTTDDRGLFLRALSHFVATGQAVRVAVDRTALLDQRGLQPHSIVVIGYDATHVEYYEPWCEDPRACAEQPLGAPGRTVPPERLALAAESLALAYQLPWKYQLTVLLPEHKPPSLSFDGVLETNARALVGTAAPEPNTGAGLVQATAKTLELHGDSVLSPELLAGVKAASQAREEDAKALFDLFSPSPAPPGAAEHLYSAGQQYERAHEALERKHLPEAVEALRAAATEDAAAGQALLAAHSTATATPDAGAP